MIPTPGMTQNSSANSAIASAVEASTISPSGAGLPHMSSQVLGQVPNQSGSQLSGLPQQHGASLPSLIQNPRNVSMDAEFEAARTTMREKIYNCLERRHHSSGDWQRRLPELAKRLEDHIFKEASTKNDYLNMVMEPVEHLLQSVLRNLPHNNQSVSHHITSSSTFSTMIPTPRMTQNSSANSAIASAVESSTISPNGAGLPQSTNMGSLLPGSVSNAYQHSSINSAGSSVASSMASMGLPRQSTQMIPTPGLNSKEMTMHPGKVNFQPLQSTQEHLLPSQQVMQQPQQQPNQLYTQFVQNKHLLLQQQQKHQQLMFKSNTLRQPSVSSSLAQQILPENAVPSHNELAALSQATAQVQLPELQGQYLQKTSYDNAKGGQLVGQLSGSQNFGVSGSQDSQQLLHPYQQSNESQNEINCIPIGSQSHALLQSQWRPHLLDRTHTTDNSSIERQIQEELHQRTTGQDEAQQPCMSVDGCISRSPAAADPVNATISLQGLEPSNKNNFTSQSGRILHLGGQLAFMKDFQASHP